jgi:hypothetical protein
MYLEKRDDNDFFIEPIGSKNQLHASQVFMVCAKMMYSTEQFGGHA